MRDLAQLPKAHLHVHLENAVRPSTLRVLAAEHRIELPDQLGDGGHEFAGFSDFCSQNTLVRSCLRRPEDFRQVAYEFCEDEAKSGIVVAPTGDLVTRTRKAHLPVTEGYFEDRWFLPGDSGYRPVPLAGTTIGFPTCWDQWFPEVARAYSLAGAEVLVYPTAIGSEPDHPGFDTKPLWERVITGNGIANATFMVAVNRVGVEERLTFYGSSFVSDPYGREEITITIGRVIVHHCMLFPDGEWR